MATIDFAYIGFMVGVVAVILLAVWLGTRTGETKGKAWYRDWGG